MADTRVSVVTTTIREPRFLEGYIESAISHGHALDKIEFLVVGDLKTPGSVRAYCSSLSNEYDADVTYIGVNEQQDWLESRELDDLAGYIPYNSIQRRNIGYLYACERGAEVIVSLDDDNLAGEDDLFGGFATVGNSQEVLEVTAPNDWFNCTSLLEYEAQDSRSIYHRGFPHSRRDDDQEYTYTRTTRDVMIRAGLWTDVPDIDVVTHLERGPVATGLRPEFDEELVALGKGTYCPVNTQNTAFHTDLMPLIHTIPMGDTLDGMVVNRFDDIWLGFFAEKILHHLGGTVAYGRPLSVHDRNKHDLLRELEHEAIGFRLNEILVDTLENIEISGDSYLECYRSLIDEFRNELGGDIDYTVEAYFREMLDGMTIWANACEKLLR